MHRLWNSTAWSESRVCHLLAGWPFLGLGSCHCKTVSLSQLLGGLNELMQVTCSPGGLACTKLFCNIDICLMPTAEYICMVYWPWSFSSLIISPDFFVCGDYSSIKRKIFAHAMKIDPSYLLLPTFLCILRDFFCCCCFWCCRGRLPCEKYTIAHLLSSQVVYIYLYKDSRWINQLKKCLTGIEFF